MKALKFDLEIPFWCSFGDFSSLNIKLSYPFPPLTAIYGLIQNALGNYALHCFEDKECYKIIKEQNIQNFNHLKFSIIIRDYGEKIEDYVNIHKGNREYENFEEELKESLEDFFKENSLEIKDFTFLTKFKFFKLLLNTGLYHNLFKLISEYWENSDVNFEIFKEDPEILKGFEKDLKKQLDDFFKNQPNEKDLKKNVTNLKKFSFYASILNTNFQENLFKEIIDYWVNLSNSEKGFDINKNWISTQISRQRLISPYFSVFIISDLEEDSDFSLQNIKKALENPKRPLYIGESDDVVNILNISLVDIEVNTSSNISSVIPGLYANSELVKIPSNIKYDDKKEYLTLCSIPKGYLDCEIDCFTYDGENFVFF